MNPMALIYKTIVWDQHWLWDHWEFTQAKYWNVRWSYVLKERFTLCHL